MRTDTDTVRAIRHFSGLGYSTAEIARAFSLGYLVCWRIVKRETYKRVTGDPSQRYLFRTLPKDPLPTARPPQRPKPKPAPPPVYKCAAAAHQVQSEGDECMSCLRKDPVFREAEATAIAESKARAREKGRAKAKVEARIRKRETMQWCAFESRGRHQYDPLNDGGCLDCGLDDAALSKIEGGPHF